MKQNIILKSLVRNPIIAILLILLIGLVSYGFVGKAVETIIVWRETNRLEGYYRSIGYVVKKDYENEQNPFSTAVDMLQDDPAIKYDDQHRQTAGFMRDYYNTDFYTGTMDVPKTSYAEASLWEGQGVNNLDYWFYGKLVYFSKEYEKDKKIDVFLGYNLIFEVDEVLAGYPERIQTGENYIIWIPSRFIDNINKMAPHLDQMEVGNRYLIRAWSHHSFNFAVAGLPISVANQYSTFNLKALDGDDLWYIPLGEDETLDLSLPEYSSICQEIDMLNQNLRSILLVGTSDMSANPNMQLDSKWNYLIEGRWLNHEDELYSNKVIVIPKALADTRGIVLGDELAITMIALDDPYISFIRGSSDTENWRNYPTQEITFEVVGIYSNPMLESNPEGDNLTSQSYVPNSSFSDEFAFPVYWSKIKDKLSGYSFVLNDLREEEQFVKTHSDELDQLGFKLEFVPNNGKSFVNSADSTQKSNWIGLILYSSASIVATGLSVFLYFRQNRQNYAIMRALGIPAKVCNRQLIVPLLVLGFISSVPGALLSWQNAHLKAAETLSELPLPSGVLPVLTLELKYGIALWLFTILVLFLGSLLGSLSVTRKPVLELLQEGQSRAKDKKQIETSQPMESLSDPTGKNKEFTMPDTLSPEQVAVIRLDKKTEKGKKGAQNVLNRFSRKTWLRSIYKTLLTIGLAGALILALGWFQSLIKENKEELASLYQSSEIQIDVMTANRDGVLRNDKPRKLINWTQESGFIGRSYLSSYLKLRTVFDDEAREFIGFPPYGLMAVNDLDEALTQRLVNYQISFLDGYGKESISEIWSEEDFGKKKIPLVVPEEIMEEQGWSLGDEIPLKFEGTISEIPFVIIGSSTGGIYVGDLSITFGPGETLIWEYKHMISNLSAIEHFILSPPDYLEAFLYSEPEMNYRLQEFKNDIEKKLPELGTVDTYVQFWDEELLSVVGPMEKNLSLMERLYPITMVISSVIGGVLSLLLVLNQAKETAVLRILGVSNGAIRKMLVGQIALLSVIGLGVGVVVLIALKGLGGFQPSLGIAALVYLVGVVLGALLGSYRVSNKKPMELLQVKE